MYTPGPAISLRTSACGLPQNRHAKPGRERCDRLETQHFLAGPFGKSRVVPEPIPLVGMIGEQPQPVCQLRLGGIGAASDHRARKGDDLVITEPVTILLVMNQRRHEVLAWLPPPPGHKVEHVVPDVLA